MSIERPESRMVTLDRRVLRGAKIEASVRQNCAIVKQHMAQEGSGWSTGLLPLLPPEGSEFTTTKIVGRVDKDNRQMLDAVYTFTGADIDNKVVYSQLRLNGIVEEVTETPVGTRSVIKEITRGKLKDGEFEPSYSQVVLFRRLT